MKQTSKSLNDLFRSASNETEGTVLSQSEIERLLRDSNMRSVPVTPRARIYRALFSTPLKTGMTAMTTLACIALALLAFWPQATPPHRVATTLLSHPAGPSQGTQPTAQTPAPSFTVHAIAHYSAPATPPTVTVPIPITTADSLHPINLSEAQLAKLGIVLEDNGDIDFYTKDGNGVDKFGLPPTWGLRIYPNEKFTKEELDGIMIQKSAPRLITAPNGAKRLFSFESDSTYSNTLNGVKTTVRTRTDIKVARTIKNVPVPIPDSSKKVINNRVVVNVFPDSLTDGTLNINIDSTTISEISNDFGGNADAIIQKEPREMHQLMDAINVLDSVKGLLVKIRELHRGLNISDSVQLQKAQVAIKQAEELMNHRGDTMVQLSRKEADSLEQSKPVSHSVKLVVRGKKIININSDSDLDEEIPTPPNPPVEQMEQMANSLDLSKLVPVRVVNNKDPEHPNVLIFWYDPTPEVEAALPKQEAVRFEPAVKHVTISIYPNPTPGPATLHFELAGANSAQYTIRNLLGEEVMRGGTLSGSTGEAPLDLTRLDAGVYLLVTTTNDGVPDVERIVVTK